MKLTRNEIFKINSVISSLEIINNNSDNLIQAINSFTEENNLKGMTYNLLKIYWETNYFNMIKNIQNSISSYKESINKVKSELELFLDGYEILDTAELPKLERRVSYYQTLISELSKTGISLPDVSLIKSYQNAISIYRKHINKLKMLPSKNSECESLLENFSEEMNSFTKNITNLTNWFSDRTFYDEYSDFLFNTYLDIEPQLIFGKFKNIFSEYEINFINEFINNERDNATTSRGKFLAVTTSVQYI